MTEYEDKLLSTSLAPWESDGPKDEDDWNLFDKCLIVGDVEDRHSLSETFGDWKLLQVKDFGFF